MPATDHLEELFDTSRSLTVLIHGLQGSRRDWCERGGYSKGGDLTDRLSALGRSWIACDLYGHGDWPATEPDFSSEHISDELFPSFLSRSADATRVAIEAAVASHDVDHLQLVTYSAGCHVAVQLLKGSLPRPVTTLALAVPTPERAYDDEYSLHNNLDVFEGRTVGMFVGRDDDEVAFDEACWFFDQLPRSAKRRWDYPVGHSLPIAWVDDAIDLLEDPASTTTAAR
jgi:pimeloyl-ACP methyl ester carboxylesterase